MRRARSPPSTSSPCWWSSRAFYWQQLLDDGVVGSGSEIAQREGLQHSTVNELLRLILLEPAIIQTILAGQQPRCMSLLWFQRNPLPTDWGGAAGGSGGIRCVSVGGLPKFS